MIIATSVSVLAISKAPLNTTFELVGFDSIMGLGRAYLLLMFLINLGVLQLISAVAAKGEAGVEEVLYTGLTIQFSEIVLSAIAGQFLGIFSLIPIFLLTSFLFVKLAGMSLRSAGKVTTIYYIYHVVSLFVARWIVARLQ